jgi:type II secretory pathway pseudopilin PulG
MTTPRMHHRLYGGFSIIEMAIVLGIVGIVLASIWAYADWAFENARRQRLSEELLTVVNNVHALYSGQAGIGGGGDQISAVTPTLIQQNAIPSTMVRSGNGCTNGAAPFSCTDDPWGPNGNITGGTFGVCAWTAAPSGAPAGTNCPAAGAIVSQFFAIEISGLPQISCINVAPQNSSASGPVGLQDVLINGASVIGAGDVLPVPPAFAVAKCVASNTIDFVYRLQAPTY